jgi:hypothetical protein
MMMKTIEVPGYVAEEFNKPLRHPSPRPDAVDVSVERVYRLINEALKGVDWPDWEVGGRRYHSVGDAEPYGFERVGDKFYIYAEERGRRTAIAVFKSRYIASDYFVWLVSKGASAIDWQLFLEMEP